MSSCIYFIFIYSLFIIRMNNSNFHTMLWYENQYHIQYIVLYKFKPHVNMYSIQFISFFWNQKLLFSSKTQVNHIKQYCSIPIEISKMATQTKLRYNENEYDGIQKRKRKYSLYCEGISLKFEIYFGHGSCQCCLVYL